MIATLMSRMASITLNIRLSVNNTLKIVACDKDASF